MGALPCEKREFSSARGVADTDTRGPEKSGVI